VLTDQEINNYLKLVRSELYLDSKKKNKIVNDLRCSIKDFSENNPSANLSDLYEEYGTPKDLACEFIGQEDGEKLKQKIHISKRIKFWIAIGIILVILIVSTITILNYIENRHYRDGYYIETIIEE
jgi:hypothetical protein